MVGKKIRVLKKKSGATILALLLVFTALVTLPLGTLLKYGITENLTNERNFGITKSRNATESIIDYGIAKLVSGWNSYVKLSEVTQDPSSPLSITSEITSFYSGTDIDTSKSAIKEGVLSGTQSVYIDPSDPANRYDPLKGQTVSAKTIDVYVKTVANVPKNGDTVTTYGKKTLQIREAPFSNFGVFYAMTMELIVGNLPWTKTDFYGPVHVNGDMWGSVQIDHYFHSSVTLSGDYRRGYYLNPSTTGTADNYFSDGDGNFVTDYKGNGARNDPGNYYDSLYSDWARKAIDLWNGNFLTKDHGVKPINPTYFPDYVRDDPSTAAVDDDLNYIYGVIEPNLKTSDVDYKGKAETNKYARKSGLIIRVHETTPSAVLNPLLGEYRVSDDYYVTFHKLLRSDPLNPTSSASLDGSGDVQEANILVDPTYVSNLISMGEYTEDGSGKPTSGFYDLRRNMGLDVLSLDVSKLREAVDDTDPSYNSSVWTLNYTPQYDYNGVVYVEFPTNTAISGRPDKVKVSKDGMGLALVNGTKVPDPSYNNASDRWSGFTLATNNAMYIKGHFNADGNMATGSETAPDNPSDPEPVTSLAADSITILSPDWNDSMSKDSLSNRRSFTDTEINAALLGGIVPADKGGSGNSSGGMDNVVRLLEKWQGYILRIRGAFQVLYESEVANQPYSTSYYDDPKREWGQYELFSNGDSAPGSLTYLVFKIIDYKTLTKSEFDSATTI